MNWEAEAGLEVDPRVVDPAKDVVVGAAGQEEEPDLVPDFA